MFGAEFYSGVKEKERVSGKVSNQRFVNSCLANSPSQCLYIHRYTHLITSSALNKYGTWGRVGRGRGGR